MMGLLVEPENIEMTMTKDLEKTKKKWDNVRSNVRASKKHGILKMETVCALKETEKIIQNIIDKGQTKGNTRNLSKKNLIREKNLAVQDQVNKDQQQILHNLEIQLVQKQKLQRQQKQALQILQVRHLQIILVLLLVL